MYELNPDLHELATKQKLERGSTYNIKGTTVNLLMCKSENKALVAAFDYLNKNRVEVSALVFDGLIVYKDTVKNINELLKDLPTESNLNAQNLELLRKGIYPYEYMDSFERFNETQLPSIDKFYSNLSDENITQQRL